MCQLTNFGNWIVSTPSVEPLLNSRVLPRFSFRFLFVVTLAFALLGATIQAALAGYIIAVSILVFLGFLLSFFVVGFLLFLVLWGLAVLRPHNDSQDASGSPFADGQLPPQILPPTNPSN
ncbi:hypothetical protein N9053_00655 [bacterium]|nr:hypothetical protein [bacterium]